MVSRAGRSIPDGDGLRYDTKRVNGFDLHYAVGGEGPPLVLVHGSFTDRRYWTLQQDWFARHFQVFAPSMRPYWPNGQATPAGFFDVPRYVDDIAKFVSALALGPVHLCGHSLGGHVAFRVALRCPGLVRTLILAEPGGPLELDLATSFLAGSPSSSMVMATAAALIAAGDVDGGLDAIITSATAAGVWRRCPAFYRESARENARTLIAQSVETRPPITISDLQAMRVPTLLIGGALSPAPFPGILDAFAAHLPDASRVRIADGTHLMNIENPDAFNAAVLYFLGVNVTV